jgi:CHAD domain-containing protein
MASAPSRSLSLSPASAADGTRAGARTKEPPLTPDSPMIALAYRCLRREYDALRKRDEQRVAPPTPEDVHQTRIATRRLRVALELFGALLPPDRTERLRRELRWFAHALGAVRDLDVHADALREHVKTAGGDAAREIGGFELALRRDRTAAHEALRALLASDRYAALMASLVELLDGAPSPAALRRWGSFTIGAGARHYLKRFRKRVLRPGRKVAPDTSADDLHRLRIRAKRLRYVFEFFSEPYPELGSAARAAKALQDVLGEHQDARTARGRVLAYQRALRKRQGSDAAAPAAVGAWGRAQNHRARQARAELAAEWLRFVSATRLAHVARR